MREEKKQDRPRSKTRSLKWPLFSGRSKGGEAAVGTGTLPVGFQGRSALAAGGCRREAKERHKQNRDFAA